MNIKIVGHEQALHLLEQSPNQLYVIFISSPHEHRKYAVEGSEKIAELAKECCELFFDDVTFPIRNEVVVQESDVRKALDFAKDKTDLIVTCQAGVSRSSAMAYCIATELDGPVLALSALNQKIHSPNELVVKHGSIILKIPEMLDLIQRWKSESISDELQGWN